MVPIICFPDRRLLKNKMQKVIWGGFPVLKESHKKCKAVVSFLILPAQAPICLSCQVQLGLISPWETYQDLFGTRVATSLGTSLPVQRSQILDLSLGPEQKQLLPFRSFTEAQPGQQHHSHPVGLLTSEAQAAWEVHRGPEQNPTVCLGSRNWAWGLVKRNGGGLGERAQKR